MTRDRLRKHLPCTRRRGFTLIEILIVGALIALFAGLAIFGAQQLYDSNRAKAMQGEAYQVGTALSWAHTDLGFYPRLHLLAAPLTQWGGQTLHVYGANIGVGRSAAVAENYNGPYLGVSQTRNRQAQGRFGLVSMTIPASEAFNDTAFNVEWPTDTWGNPYMLYLVTTDPAVVTAQNPNGYRLIRSPGENPDILSAVVSYGPNNVPGGNDNTLLSEVGLDYARNIATPGMLYDVEFEAIRSVTAPRRLKTYNATDPLLQLDNADFLSNMAQSLQPNDPDPGNGIVGLLETGTDDIIFRF